MSHYYCCYCSSPIFSILLFRYSTTIYWIYIICQTQFEYVLHLLFPSEPLNHLRWQALLFWAIMSVALVYLGLVQDSPGEGSLPRCVPMKGRSGCLVLSSSIHARGLAQGRTVSMVSNTSRADLREHQQIIRGVPCKEHTMSVSTNRSVFGKDWYLVWGFEELKPGNKAILEPEIKFQFV